ncbi:twin-arginine translocation signal domain-containing protein [Kitasatospora purpeofusca]|uniref:twin-arginine translocation signal domain-containing protein n=1 Tax=Kitasatospora purpeofusca TaxID=67352 RepID=UPI00338F0253
MTTPERHGISRRSVLRGAAVAGAGAAISPLLTSPPPRPAATPSASTRRASRPSSASASRSSRTRSAPATTACPPRSPGCPTI